MNDINVLVISANAFSNELNNGKTYKAIFSAFEKKQLHQLYFRPQEAKFIDFEFCSDYYLVSEISLLGNLFYKNTLIHRKKNELATTNDSYTHLYNSIFKKVITPNGILRDLVWKTNLWKNNTFKKWCTETNANVVFFVAGGSGYSHNIARYVSQFLNIPLVVYFTDDYLIHPHSKNLSSKIHKLRMKTFYQKTIDQSSLFFGIGDLMAAEYSHYFNRKFFPIMNSTEILPYSAPYLSGPIIISYFGGLHTGRWQMIARLAKILRGTAVIKVFSFDKITKNISSFFEEFGVLLCSGVTGSEYRKELAQSNILLHVESDDKYYRSLTHLSISTKIPEYLMSGRLVLAFGPTELASMRILADNNVGLVISSEYDDLTIINQIEMVIKNREYQIEMGIKAYEFAKSNFDNKIISTNFKEELLSLVNLNKASAENMVTK